MSSFNLTQVISEPAWIVNDCSSLIGLAFVFVPGMVQSCETILPLANSDHLGIYLTISTKLKQNPLKPQLQKVWRYTLADFDQAVELLDSVEWEALLDESDVDMYWSSFKHYFLQIMEICIPHALVKPSKMYHGLPRKLSKIFTNTINYIIVLKSPCQLRLQQNSMQ